MYAKLIIHKPITYIAKIIIYLVLNFINIFILKNKTCIMKIEKKIAFDNLRNALTYIKNKSDSRIKPWDTEQDTYAG